MKPTIVVGYDHTPSSERALTEAGREAAWRGASVSVVHAFHYLAAPSPVSYVPMGVEVSLKDIAEAAASAGMNTLRERYPGLDVTSKVIAGPAADALAEAARDADLLLLGNRGRGGFAGLLLGSVSMRTLSFASCPTMIVRGPERDPADTVVLALDLEDPADEVLAFAFDEASRRGAHLRVITVWDLDYARSIGHDAEFADARAQAVADVHAALEKLLNPWETRHPEVRVHIDVADGAPGAVLTEATEHADLIVVGAHRRVDSHLGMRLGPIAHTLLHHAECPVAVVPRAETTG